MSQCLLAFSVPFGSLDVGVIPATRDSQSGELDGLDLQRIAAACTAAGKP